jgi:hypothetical protein
VEARFPGDGDAPAARSTFEWALDRQFLTQRTEVPVPEAPDGLMIVSADPETGAYTQHYYDSRGVVRIYAMSLADGVWTLTRESPDFTPLDFRQRSPAGSARRAAALPGHRRLALDPRQGRPARPSHSRAAQRLGQGSAPDGGFPGAELEVGRRLLRVVGQAG